MKLSPGVRTWSVACMVAGGLLFSCGSSDQAGPGGGAAGKDAAVEPEAGTAGTGGGGAGGSAAGGTGGTGGGTMGGAGGTIPDAGGGAAGDGSVVTGCTTKAECSDGNACNGEEACTAGVCASGAPLACTDGNPCTKDRCVPASGCDYSELEAAGTSCDDGDFCTVGETCDAAGVCGGGTSNACDDANPCTVDSCSNNACSNSAAGTDGTACGSDGNVCTLDTCLGGKCHEPVAAATVVCAAGTCSGTLPDAVSTAQAYCDGTAVCPMPASTLCGSSVPCNASGTACQGACGTQADCPSTYYCGPTGDCVPRRPQGGVCASVDMCKSGLSCVDGYCCDTACGGGNPNDCQSCAVNAGTCTVLPDATSCDDGQSCTATDVCTGGACAGTVSCDDGNACTSDACGTSGACSHTVLPDNTACPSDGNACTTNDYCLSGVCTGDSPPACADDNNPCTTPSCDPVTGCGFTVATNGTAVCTDDGNPCTNETCQGGLCHTPEPTTTLCGSQSCTGGVTTLAATCDAAGTCTTATTVTCSGVCNAQGTGCQGNCTTDAECASLGAYYCAPGSNTCTAKLAAGAACSIAGACQSGFCVDGVCCNGGCGGGNPQDCQACNLTGTLGSCTLLSAGSSCDDGSPCTTSDVCGASGTCGGSYACDDANPCTTDTCDASLGCQHAPALNGTACSDGNPCTLGDQCSGGACKGGAPNACDDGNVCTADSCDAGTGSCLHDPAAKNGASCSDNNACTTSDTCSAGSCVAGAALACNDGDPCNGVEQCFPDSGCIRTSGPLVCADDGYSCTEEYCVKGTGCVSTPHTDWCNDGKYCTVGEQCDPASAPSTTTGCTAGVARVCDDGVACTTDACSNLSAACVFTPQDRVCETGLYCDGQQICDPAGGCITVPGTVPVCEDGVSCTVDTCNESIRSCTTTYDNAFCSDGLFCNGAESCNPGAGGSSPTTGCASGAPPSCPSSGCAQGSCVEATDTCTTTDTNQLCSGSTPFCVGGSCVAKTCGVAADCNDSNACNGVEACSSGVCVAGTPVSCNDNVACTVDSCNPATGLCVHTATNSLCDDKLPCNGVEACNAQTGCYTATPPPSCADAYTCTTDSCIDAQGGCVHLPNDTVCTSTFANYCVGDKLAGVPYCDPTNAPSTSTGCVQPAPTACPADSFSCTTEVCSEAAKGCTHLPDNSLCPCGQTCDPTKGCGNYCVVSKCGNQVYQCGDCIDNDGDCRIDTLGDESCLGPCQDSEQMLTSNISGGAASACTMDCYWDSNSGSGNDDCYWDHRCDPLQPEGAKLCPYDANFKITPTMTCSQAMTAQSLQCWDPALTDTTHNVCGSVVPNGCDCFGCCAVPGTNYSVYLGSKLDKDHVACTVATLTDPTQCFRCTQVPSCMNTCATCEICFQKTTLPAECSCQVCQPGQQLCGAPCGTPCPAGQFCSTGCCVPSPS